MENQKNINGRQSSNNERWKRQVEKVNSEAQVQHCFI